jgi:hypothetical protein
MMPHRNKETNKFYMPIPLDFLILAKLPEKGMLGGIHWKGRRLKDVYEEIVTKDLNGDKTVLKPTEIMARSRSMHVAGYLEPFGSMRANEKIWARTPEGSAFLDRRGEILGEG